jgi:hypothetical protein
MLLFVFWHRRKSAPKRIHGDAEADPHCLGKMLWLDPAPGKSSPRSWS